MFIVFKAIILAFVMMDGARDLRKDFACDLLEALTLVFIIGLNLNFLEFSVMLTNSAIRILQ
jgi:hypothetical protein